MLPIQETSQFTGSHSTCIHTLATLTIHKLVYTAYMYGCSNSFSFLNSILMERMFFATFSHVETMLAYHWHLLKSILYCILRHQAMQWLESYHMYIHVIYDNNALIIWSLFQISLTCARYIKHWTSKNSPGFKKTVYPFSCGASFSSWIMANMTSSALGTYTSASLLTCSSQTWLLCFLSSRTIILTLKILHTNYFIKGQHWKLFMVLDNQPFKVLTASL